MPLPARARPAPAASGPAAGMHQHADGHQRDRAEGVRCRAILDGPGADRHGHRTACRGLQAGRPARAGREQAGRQDRAPGEQPGVRTAPCDLGTLERGDGGQRAHQGGVVQPGPESGAGAVVEQSTGAVGCDHPAGGPDRVLALRRRAPGTAHDQQSGRHRRQGRQCVHWLGQPAARVCLAVSGRDMGVHGSGRRPAKPRSSR